MCDLHANSNSAGLPQAAGEWCSVVDRQTHVGGCQNDGPFLGTLNIRCRTTIGIQKGTIILTTTHVGGVGVVVWWMWAVWVLSHGV